MMSALPPKAEVAHTMRDVRYVPLAEVSLSRFDVRYVPLRDIAVQGASEAGSTKQYR
jgi:hypothetical protein